jgi:glutathione S-transferase
MYTLYIGNKNYSSWSLRPWVLMQAIDIPFEERVMPFDPGGYGASHDTFRIFSPSGLVPCLHDDETVIWESLGIVEYLAERHTGVWPTTPRSRAWARSATAEMHAGFGALRNTCTMNIGLRIRLHETPPALVRDIARLDELWTEGLTRFGGPFLAGEDFTAVDAFYAPVAFRIRTYGLTLSHAPAAYGARLLTLPAMQRWEADALAETWREPGHEEEARAVGEILEDRRAPLT